MNVSVILPTYNESENIRILIPSLAKVLKKNKIKYEIIVVDDSSTDGTAGIAKRFDKKYGKVNVIVRKGKTGIGSAIRDGYNSAKNDLLVSMDSDLSFEVEDVIRLIKKINEGYDIVVGNRHVEKGNYKADTKNVKLKRLVSRYGNVLTGAIVGINLKDFSANFRAMRKGVWKSIQTEDNTNSILLEMIVAAKAKGYRLGEIPVVFKERRYGKSKLNLAKEAPKFFAKALMFRLKYR